MDRDAAVALCREKCRQGCCVGKLRSAVMRGESCDWRLFARVEDSNLGL
jgi:hypothetical protein